MKNFLAALAGMAVIVLPGVALAQAPDPTAGPPTTATVINPPTTTTTVETTTTTEATDPPEAHEHGTDVPEPTTTTTSVLVAPQARPPVAVRVTPVYTG
jgi:cytoskeletal protein RodZ